jgi:chemotaxis protein histidine kinase CheA
MTHRNWYRLAVAVALAAALASCYTLPGAPKKKQSDLAATAAASAALHEAIYEFVQGTLYTHPHVATRVGMHTYRLPKGEEVDLDRELPNYSTDLIDARVETLEALLERVERKIPEAALSPNDLADRRLLAAAIRAELYDWKQLELHRRDPLLHARALAEALYYPLIVPYAPEEERIADVLGRLHWAPAYLERAARMIESASEPAAAAAVEVNRFTVALVRTELDARIPKGNGELRATYDGMKGPVLEALDGFQRFLEKDLGGKKITWRLGKERTAERFARAFHGAAATPDEALEAAEAALTGLRREIYDLALPAYCEVSEKDRENCGPTKAELAAVARAEQDRLRKEEEQKKKAAEEEKRREEEERKQAAEEEKRQKEAEKKAAEETKKAAEEDKAKKKKDISNPYADPPKKEPEKKSPSGVTNPYGFYRLPAAEDTAGAKLAGQDDAAAGSKAKKSEPKAKKSVPAAKKDEPEAKKSEPAAKPDEPTAAMLERVVAFVFEQLRKPETGEGGAVGRLKDRLPAVAEDAVRRGVLDTAAVEGLEVADAPALLVALHCPLHLVPQPVFQPVQGARLFAPDGDKDGLAVTRTFAVAAALGAPGRYAALRRVVSLEPETRRALRVLHGDPAWLAGFGLYAAEQLARAGDEAEGAALPRDLLATLAEVIRAAVELSAAVRMHTGDLSEKDAAAELIARAGLDRSLAEQRVRRIQLAPLEAAAGFLGWRAWDAAGAAAKDRSAFHARALGFGPVPLPDLPALLAAADPDAAPDYEGPPPAEPEPEGKRRVSILDAL